MLPELYPPCPPFFIQPVKGTCMTRERYNFEIFYLTPRQQWRVLMESSRYRDSESCRNKKVYGIRLTLVLFFTKRQVEVVIRRPRQKKIAANT